MAKAKIIAEPTVLAPVGALKPHPMNPRVGNVDAIVESLKVNQQYRPIVVQKKTNLIIAGNHTWKAAKKLGWDEIAVTYVDVDDEAAKRIMLADNRTNDLASYDTSMLAKVLETLPSSEGTGYTLQDAQLLIDSLHDVSIPQEVLDDIANPQQIRMTTIEEEATREMQDMASGGSVGGMARPDLAADEEVQEFDDVTSELQGVLELKEGILFPIENPFGFPTMRRDRLAPGLPCPPDKLRTWGGKESHTQEERDDEELWWFANYGIGSLSGCAWERMILSFYTYDDKFENWWALPAFYTAKAINSGLRYIVTPDFSIWEEQPPALHIINLYRATWLARYFQEAGLTVIPWLKYGNPKMNDNYIKYSLPPRGVKIAATSMQTFDRHQPGEIEYSLKGIAWAIDYVQPEQLIVYAGPPGHRLLAQALGMTQHKPELISIPNYAKVRRDAGVYDKNTRAKGTKAQVKAAMGDEEDEDWEGEEGEEDDEE